MNDLRAAAWKCFEAALGAVEPARLVSEALPQHDLEEPVTVAAVGKAAGAMVAGASSVLGGRLESGLLVTTRDAVLRSVPSSIDVVLAGHPVPDGESLEAGRRIKNLAERSAVRGSFLLLLSGGASALMTLPASELGLRDLQITTTLLLRSGAPIEELNAVRKHLDALKGGRLARLVGGGRKLGLVLSDVVGDRLDVIASGPLVPDATTFQEAVSVLRKRKIWDEVPRAVLDHLDRGCRGIEDESPAADDRAFERSSCIVVGGNRTAQEAARREAGRLAFETVMIEEPLVGEARDAGRYLAAEAAKLQHGRGTSGRPVCLIAGGETTVTLAGAGKGGRNQELALAAALEIQGRDGILVAAMGTDGKDGPTDAAGAWVDGQTVGRARLEGFDASVALAENDSYPCLAAAGDLLMTGPTGTNVADLSLALLERQ